MFVFEDPGRKRGERARFLQYSIIKSHLTAKAHARRRLTERGRFDTLSWVSPSEPATPAWKLENPISPDAINKDIVGSTREGRNVIRLHTERTSQPFRASNLLMRPSLNVHGSDSEARSFQFFMERTALQWSGHHDTAFWTNLALQAAHSNSSIRHSLICLGAFHEMKELPDIDERKYFRKRMYEEHARKALVTAQKQLQEMNIATVLTLYTALAMVTLFVTEFKYFTIVEMQHNIMEQIRCGILEVSPIDSLYIEQYLIPIVSRWRVRESAYLDMIYVLRRTSTNCFYTVHPTSIPERFESLSAAREFLEATLNRTTYLVKSQEAESIIILSEATTCVNLYSTVLDRSWQDKELSQGDRCRIALLKVAAKLGLMIIQNLTVDENDLMFFDGYSHLFAELAACFRQVLAYFASQSRSNMTFGTDVGLISLVGHSARWCRDPAIRRELCKLLRHSQRQEGTEGSTVQAICAETAMKLEEADIYPSPASCSSVPLTKRVKFYEIQVWAEHSMRLRFKMWPYGAENFCDVWMDRVPNGKAQCFDTNPDLITGLGYCSILNTSRSDQYCTVKASMFYFPIPTL